MLNSSYVKFIENPNKLAVEFKTKDLDKYVLESILNRKTEDNFEINSNKLQLLNYHDKYNIALLYNIELVDARVGWLLQKSCMTSEDLGFIITPMSRWHRHRVIQCFKAIDCNIYTAYFDLDKLNQGLIYLVIDYSNW
jgi:hypothetical protein